VQLKEMDPDTTYSHQCKHFLTYEITLRGFRLMQVLKNAKKGNVNNKIFARREEIFLAGLKA